VRLGLRYVRGLREESGRAIVSGRPYHGIDDLARRVPQLRKDEMRKLAAAGALNPLQNMHRRDALWESERVTRFAGPLLDEEAEPVSVLAPMNTQERLAADFRGTGVTVGRPSHGPPPAGARRTRSAPRHRPEEHSGWPLRACRRMRNRAPASGYGEGFVFLSLEDETGISNIIVEPDLFARERQTLVSAPFLLVEGALQNQDRVVSVKAHHVSPLPKAPRPNRTTSIRMRSWRARECQSCWRPSPQHSSPAKRWLIVAGAAGAKTVGKRPTRHPALRSLLHVQNPEFPHRAGNRRSPRCRLHPRLRPEARRPPIGRLGT
jgi:DNA polymerase III alpha subunit